MVTRTEQRLKAGDDLIVWSEEAGPYNSEPEELWEKVRDEHSTAALFYKYISVCGAKYEGKHIGKTLEKGQGFHHVHRVYRVYRVYR